MAARDNVGLDRIVDYKAEYTAAISREKLRISGDSLLGLCPFHHESNPSFSVDLKTGRWNCFTEGESGNFITFYAKLHGIDTGTAYNDCVQRGYQNAKMSAQAAGGKLLSYSETWNIDSEGNLTMISCGTVEYDTGTESWEDVRKDTLERMEKARREKEEQSPSANAEDGSEEISVEALLSKAKARLSQVPNEADLEDPQAGLSAFEMASLM